MPVVDFFIFCLLIFLDCKNVRTTRFTNTELIFENCGCRLPLWYTFYTTRIKNFSQLTVQSWGKIKNHKHSSLHARKHKLTPAQRNWKFELRITAYHLGVSGLCILISKFHSFPTFMLCFQIFKISFNQRFLAFQCSTVQQSASTLCIYIHVCVLRCFSCVRFFVTPCDPLSVEFSRQEH